MSLLPLPNGADPDTGMGDPVIAAMMNMPSPFPQASEPFTWGQGGARITPEELARQRMMADAQTKSDYSPVGHWTQGLGRVVDGILGGLDERRLDKAQASNAEYSDQIAQALLGGDASGAGAAMIDPYASKGVQGLAKMVYERENPKPVNNDTVADYQFFKQFGPDAGKQFVDSKLDPIVNIPLPGGQVYVGPRSGMAQFVGGGGPASGTAGAMAPASPSIDFSVFTPEEIAVWQKEAARRKGGQNIPSGSPVSPPKTLPPDFDFGGH